MQLPHKILVQRLTEHSQALALPAGRRVGQPGHDVAREYLLGQMERIGLKPFEGGSFELPYERLHPNTRELQGFINLVGVIPGRDRSLPPILLGAHYDSVIDAPCVDDNATSVAHNLLLADHFVQEPLERDLIIAFFDAEEPPFFLGECMGSRRFCEDYCGDIDFAAVIVTDLVGHDATDGGLPIPGPVKTLLPHLKNLIGVMGAESDGSFPAIVEAAAKDADELRVLSVLHRYVGPVSDHAAFVDAGQPFLFLSCGMGRYYHTPQDTMGWINFDKLAHTTRFIADLVVRIDRTPADANHERFDPFETDLRMLKKALGPMASVGLRAMGIKIPESRRELDHFLGDLVVGRLMS
ncbi:M28 family peptidase [Haloferula sp. BvORR071]|uniref:M28 family peptidase n=1 Tax=Haloferula sp. BvORR071 TaxID=1396141 RepID=UPI000697FDCC|nr:M28 family peptidase [Haloferula sp. BvORR071]